MNLKYQFYKGYYKNFDPCWFGDDKRTKAVEAKNTASFESINKRLFAYSPGRHLDKWPFTKDHFGDQLRQFKLETTYPGLTSGTGYTHETGNVGEFKVGFHFDHTSGLPMLPGHSVKGAVRAAFPKAKMEPKSTEPQSIKIAKAAYIIDLLGLAEDVTEDRLAWVTELELQIFGTSHAAETDKNEGKKEGGKTLPKDIFLDAMICKADKKGKILGPDFITPHGDKVWKNPTPLLFLKVLPEVQWQFSFLLSATKIKGTDVTADMKEALFKAILLDMGIGAKSNVGYGHFVDPENRPSQKNDPKGDLASNAPKEYPLDDRPEHQERQKPLEVKEIKAEFYSGKLKYRNQFEAYAEVLELVNRKTMVKVFLKEDNCPLGDLGRNNNNKNNLKEGDILIVEVKLKTNLSEIEYVNFVTNKSKK